MKETNSNLAKKENSKKSFHEFRKAGYKDDQCNPRKDTRTRIAKLHKGDWEDQVEEVESMFRNVTTGEWYSLLKW